MNLGLQVRVQVCFSLELDGLETLGAIDVHVTAHNEALIGLLSPMEFHETSKGALPLDC